MTLETVLFGVTLFLYFVASVSYHAHLFTGNDRARRVATLLVAGGVIVHFGAIGVWCTAHRGQSILRDPAMPFSLVAWFLAITQVAAGLWGRWAALGSLSTPVAFFAQFYAAALTPGSAVHDPPGGRLLSPHVMAILLGFAAFTLAFCLAVIYLVQSRLLKTKQVRGLFSRLPPLESVSTGAHWLAATGFSMLTLGIVTGIIAAPQHWYTNAHVLSGVVTSLVAWAIYAAYLGASMLMGWRGRRTTYFLIAGYLVVLVAFLVSIPRPKPPQTPHAQAEGAALPVGKAALPRFPAPG
jgi:ABC-type uncharacterized transport system permease subunit